MICEYFLTPNSKGDSEIEQPSLIAPKAFSTMKSMKGMKKSNMVFLQDLHVLHGEFGKKKGSHKRSKAAGKRHSTFRPYFSSRWGDIAIGRLAPVPLLMRIPPIFSVLAVLLAFSLPGCSGRPPADTPSDPLALLVEIYRGPLNHLEAVRPGGCPMVPSCSQYAREALAVHGPAKGWVMICDRLMRCGRDEVHLAEPVLRGGYLHAYDPVAANAFWGTPQVPPGEGVDRDTEF